MRKYTLLLLLVLFQSSGYIRAQLFRGVIINSIDSTVVPNAAVSVGLLQRTFITNDKGEFSFQKPTPRMSTLELTVSAIGCKATILYHITNEPLERIYVEILPNTLADYTIVGLSAEEVVSNAVKLIPENNTDSGFFASSSYRQYQKINGKFSNYIEAKPVVMFGVQKKKNRLLGSEAFAVSRLRRTALVYEPGHPNSNNIAQLMEENVVYHLEGSSMDPAKFSKYRFTFDTSIKNDSYYVVKYFINDFSLEKHGVEQLGNSFWGESYEKGELRIERGSFALISLKRNTYRYRNYTYPKNGGNNWVMPEKRYYVELRDGELELQYTKMNGKWYPYRMNHRFTNEFYRGGWGSMEYVVTCYYEWQNDSVSRYTTDEYHDRFFPKMQVWNIPYDAAYWKNENFPFHFNLKEAVFKELASTESNEPAFIINEKEGK